MLRWGFADVLQKLRDSMIKRTIVFDVNLPSDEIFKNKYKQYAGKTLTEYRQIYDFLMDPNIFLKASIATKDLKLPAVAGVAYDIYNFAMNNNIEWKNITKQFIGAVICTIMESNGYKKTGIKKGVPHPAFTRGEVYELID